MLLVGSAFKALKDKSFLDEAFGFIGYAGLNPAYKIKIKGFFLLTLFFDVDFICGVCLRRDKQVSPAYIYGR
jgi:hypothetical protein